LKLDIATASTEEKNLLEQKDMTEMLDQLKKKFNQEENRSNKVQILTVLPSSWSRRKIAKEFNTTQYMASVSKSLVKEKEILSHPNPKPGKTLDESIVKLMEKFYNSDEISREMPGMKDKVTYKQVKTRSQHKND